MQGPSGPRLDRDQTNIDGPWQSRSWSQQFCQGPDCPVSGPAKMARDRTRPNFPNTTPNINMPWLSNAPCAPSHWFAQMNESADRQSMCLFLPIVTSTLLTHFTCRCPSAPHTRPKAMTRLGSCCSVLRMMMQAVKLLVRRCASSRS